MAVRRKNSWGTFKNEMKAKRRKTGDGGAKKNERDNILERQELVVQRPSSEVSGKTQKCTRVGPYVFVPYDEEELSIEGIKAACEKHFSPSLERKGSSCDVLAGVQGPSCHSFIRLGKLPKFEIDKLLGITCFAFGESVLCAMFGSCRFRREGVTGSLKHCCLDSIRSRLQSACCLVCSMT